MFLAEKIVTFYLHSLLSGCIIHVMYDLQKGRPHSVLTKVMCLFQGFGVMNVSSANGTSAVSRNHRDMFLTAVTKNVIVTALCISINYINGTQIHTFTRHQVWHRLLHLYICTFRKQELGVYRSKIFVSLGNVFKRFT